MLWNDEKSDRLLSSVLFFCLKWNREGENKGGGIICRECLLKDAEDVFYAEQNDTIFHYLKTRPCGTMYFIGACIYGNPIFLRVEDVTNEQQHIFKKETSVIITVTEVL